MTPVVSAMPMALIGRRIASVRVVFGDTMRRLDASLCSSSDVRCGGLGDKQLQEQIVGKLFNLMKRPTGVQTHVHTSTNCIPLVAVVHSCELRSPNLYEGLEIRLYEGLGISFEIRVLTLMLYPLDTPPN
jgi:hypothetical protein